MSATREDVLAELGLSPRWVLRAPVAAKQAQAVVPESVEARSAIPAAQAVDAPAPAGDAASAPVLPAVDEDEARRARIAALTWADFASDVAGCRACKLCATRNKAVPGVGDARADWLFVGEAPGAEEDARGEPFVGQAGRLLDNMLQALGLGRTRHVYIANVLKCRPPNNRAPEPAEADACSPYLARQIELIEPKLVVALGKTAASLLLRTDASVASLRGRVHRYRGLPLVVTYHPAYLLRTLPDKAKAWEDLVFARSVIEREGGPAPA